MKSHMGVGFPDSVCSCGSGLLSYMCKYTVHIHKHTRQSKNQRLGLAFIGSNLSERTRRVNRDIKKMKYWWYVNNSHMIILLNKKSSQCLLQSGYRLHLHRLFFFYLNLLKMKQNAYWTTLKILTDDIIINNYFQTSTAIAMISLSWILLVTIIENLISWGEDDMTGIRMTVLVSVCRLLSENSCYLPLQCLREIVFSSKKGLDTLIRLKYKRA